MQSGSPNVPSVRVPAVTRSPDRPPRLLSAMRRMRALPSMRARPPPRTPSQVPEPPPARRQPPESVPRRAPTDQQEATPSPGERRQESARPVALTPSPSPPSCSGPSLRLASTRSRTVAPLRARGQAERPRAKMPRSALRRQAPAELPVRLSPTQATAPRRAKARVRLVVRCATLAANSSRCSLRVTPSPQRSKARASGRSAPPAVKRRAADAEEQARAPLPSPLPRASLPPRVSAAQQEKAARPPGSPRGRSPEPVSAPAPAGAGSMAPLREAARAALDSMAVPWRAPTVRAPSPARPAEG